LQRIRRPRGKMRVVNVQNQDRVKSFDSLLEWLDPDRERAAEKYEVIRRSLIQIFIWKSCSEAESLADETLDRVMLRIPQLREMYEGSPSAYIHGVAKRVLAEHMRARSVQRETLVPENPKTTDIKNDKMYGCLERCLPNLSPSSRDLILNYYSVENPKKLSPRKDFAEQLGVSHNQLRVRLYRIRKMLEACIQACMEHEGSA
jgi:DNA-directed RNA polymerase specialized sigma24 family protein